jgi:hypothetical protein
MAERAQKRCAHCAAANDELIREVRHAAGNLVQRMQYWTVLLEDQGTLGGAQESLTSLRTSLDALHRLFVRSLDLLRTTETRTSGISLRDLLVAIRLRFDGVDEPSVLDTLEHRHTEVVVDPLILERAFEMLSEGLSWAEAATNGRASATVTVEKDRKRAQHVAVLTLDSVSAPRGPDPFAHVHARVTLALALKLFIALGFTATVDEGEDSVSVRITLPLRDVAVRADSRSTHSTRSRHSGETSPL